VEEERRGELVEQFLMFIGQIIRGMDTIFRREMEAFEVTWPQFHMLKMIQVCGRVTVTELSNMLMIAPPTASRMIDSLVNKELLEKQKDTADQRVTYIALTPKSEKLLETLLALQNQVMSEVFEGEDIDDLEKNMRDLGRIARRWFEIAERRSKRADGQPP